MDSYLQEDYIVSVRNRKSKLAALQFIYLWPYLPSAKCKSLIERTLKIYKFQVNTRGSVSEFLSLLLFRLYNCLFLPTDINVTYILAGLD